MKPSRAAPLYQISQTIRARRIELIDKEVEHDAQIASQHSPVSQIRSQLIDSTSANFLEIILRIWIVSRRREADPVADNRRAPVEAILQTLGNNLM